MSHRATLPALAPLIDALEQSRDPRRTAFDALPDLLTSPDWLPASLLTPDPAGYRRELLYQPPDARYSIGCFVWAPGQKTAIHDHTCWGALGVLTGELREQSFTLSRAGALAAAQTRSIPRGGRIWCGPGEEGIHQVAGGDRLSVSIHVYGNPFDQICRTLYEGNAA